MSQEPRVQPPLLSFYADDFTGATDSLEVLARGGIGAALFTAPPSPQALASMPGLRAFGVAGRSRAWTPSQMRGSLPSIFRALAAAKPRILHYKVCSTFDSSPTIGSIGSVIEIGRDLFGSAVPILAGAPDLGRYCVFGNLFARYGAEGPVYRIDRHPSMSRHPVTPMDEADLRLHLARQTSRTLGLLSAVDLPDAARFQALLDEFDAVLIDIVNEQQFAAIGALIDGAAGRRQAPMFVIGSSGIESALCAHWKHSEMCACVPPAAPAAGPVLAVCGSCSPVTREQRRRAASDGFVEVLVDPADVDAAVAAAVAAIHRQESVVLAVNDTTAAGASADAVAVALASATRTIVDFRGVARLLVAGGDTSGAVADALGIESMRIAGSLVRGAPLMLAAAAALPGGGIEVVFKGGQIGPVEFLQMVKTGAQR